jgi:hypothetical protein
LRGIATAMVGDFPRWLGTRQVIRVRAAVRPDDAASLAVPAHHGFARVDEQWDDEDGLEVVPALKLSHRLDILFLKE